jgi:hypothetical protein
VWRNVTDGLARGSFRASLTLSLLVAAVFGPACTFDFVHWDDPVNVTHNPLVTEPWSADLVARILNGDTALRFKPLPWLLYRGVHALFGLNPAAWHLLNLILHLAAVILLRLVLKAVLERVHPTGAPDTREWLAWVGAALWGVHPAHVEPACWVTATPYPLLALFLLGSFRFYIRAMDPARVERSAADMRSAWWLALAGYATYPVGVTYGLWLMAADVWIFRTAPRDWRRGKEILRWGGRHALFLLPAAVGVFVTWKSSSATPWLYPAPPTLAELDLLARLKMSTFMLGSVWTSLFSPLGHTPNNPILPSWRMDSIVVVSTAFLAVAMLTTAWLLRRRWPGVTGVVWGCAAVSLPVLGFGQWPHSGIADRYAYLPHLILTGGLIGLLAFQRDLRAGKVCSAPLLLAVVVGLAVLGRSQVMIWRNTDTLFNYLEVQPAFDWHPAQQAHVYLLWAAHAQEHGRTTDAQAKALRARRSLQDGSLMAAERHAWAEAVEISRFLEQSFGLPPLLRRERVRWLMTLGRVNEADHDLERILREMPDDHETRLLLNEWRKRAEPAPANHL